MRREGVYNVKEVFYTLQGEGAHAGRPAVFLRFAGCNLWSGREANRGESCSAWCDTDFVGGERLNVIDLCARVADLWPGERAERFVVLTGGEPMIQVDTVLVDSLHRFGFAVAVETNGTRPVPPCLDWITVSPKEGHPLVQRRGQEIKVVWPQALDLDELAGLVFDRRYLQPMDGLDREANTAACVARCLADPRWRLSLQTHKILGIA